MQSGSRRVTAARVASGEPHADDSTSAMRAAPHPQPFSPSRKKGTLIIVQALALFS